MQKSLINETELRGKKELIQKADISRKTDENSILIEELNKNKSKYTKLEKQWKNLQSENSAIKKALENLQRKEKERERELTSKRPKSKVFNIYIKLGTSYDYATRCLPIR